jgi:hypothetical protein
MRHYMIVILPVVMFYVAIPGLGALLIRHRWRKFRRMLVFSASYTRLGYSDTRVLSDEDDGYLGRYRFFGSLEAIQGSSVIRVRGKNVSVSVAMKNIMVFLLPTASPDDDTVSDQTPSPVRWSKVSALPEGIKVYVAGSLYREKDLALFQEDSHGPLLVVIYDGPDSELVNRSIWCGRQKNEYWNRFTPVSLLAGSLTLGVVIISGAVSPVHQGAVVTALTAAVAPVLPLLPPGVALFVLYRRIWTVGRHCRAERDLFRFVGMYASGSIHSNERYGMIRVSEHNVAEYRDLVSAANTPLQDNVLVFGALTRHGGEYRITRPRDPMAPYIALSDKPAVLAHRRAVRARVLEVLAVVCLGIGIAVNAVLCAVFLQYFLP